MSTNVVTPAQFDEITRLLEKARVERELSMHPNLTLAEKLELQRRAKHYRALALAIH